MKFKNKIGQFKSSYFWLIVSSGIIKILGIFRESIIAYYIGSSLGFATFNSLRSIIDILMGFVIGVPIIEGLLLPKYVPLYNGNPNISFFFC